MGSLTDRLETYIETVEIQDHIPAEMSQRWILLSAESGLRAINSQYLLLPVEIYEELKKILGSAISNKRVKKFCHLAVEKTGERPPRVRIIYDFQMGIGARRDRF